MVLFDNIVGCLEDNFSDFKRPVTDLSKTTDGNEFIVNDVVMFDWDEMSKLPSGDDFSSVDAVYYCLSDEGLVFYFFEFKNLNLYGSTFDAKKELEDYLNKMDECEECQMHSKNIRKIKKNLVSKKIVSLKTKPLESLILLHNILQYFGISHEELIGIRKEYYVVSKTIISGNKSNFHRKGRSGELFGFIDKIKPFLFSEVQPITEKTFLSMIDELERKQKFTNNV